MQLLASEALALARAVGDLDTEALALVRLGTAAHLHQHDLALGRRYFEESLALERQGGRAVRAAGCLTRLGEIARAEGDYAAAARWYEEALAICRQSGNRAGVTVDLFNLGEVAAAQNDPATARRYHQEALAIAEEIGFRMDELCLGGLGHSAAAMGDVRLARRYFGRALTGTVAIGSPPITLYVLVGFARLKALAGEQVPAAEWLGLVLTHPSRETDSTQRANALLAELRQTLPAEELEPALARGRALDLQAVMDELLAQEVTT
jgi:tetratricopeptide (TPR) repeat protein